VVRQLDVQGECLRGNCGSKFEFTGRVAERELWSEIWI